MYDKKLESLIDAALIDGNLTEKEKDILSKKAKALGIDLDEFEMVLDARLFEKKQAMQVSAPLPPTPPPVPTAQQSEKYGDVKKCPACGAMVESFKTGCGYCGHEFTNVDASQNITKFFEKLDALESDRKENLFHAKEDKTTFGVGTLLKWWIFWWILIPLKSINFILNQIKPAKWSTTDSRKEEMIMNFPVPNSREEIIEFITLAVSRIRKVNLLDKFDEEGKYVSKWNSIWKRKAEQVFIKAKLSMTDDRATLKSIEQILLEAQVIKAKK